jgi:hypothetical protein
MTVEDLAKAIAKLAPEEFAQFREWFAEFDAARFDRKIEQDIERGKLNQIAEAALADFRNGRTREL